MPVCGNANRAEPVGGWNRNHGWLEASDVPPGVAKGTQNHEVAAFRRPANLTLVREVGPGQGGIKGRVDV